MKPRVSRPANGDAGSHRAGATEARTYGVPVEEIGQKAGALFSSLPSLDLFEIVDQVGPIHPSAIDIGEILGELKARFDELDPAMKVPVAVAAGFVGARVVRWIVR